MHLLYYGLASDEECLQKRLKHNASPYLVAQQSFESAMLDEMEKGENLVLYCNRIPQEPAFPKGGNLYIKARRASLSEKTSIKDLSCVNLPVIKFIWLFFAAFCRTARFLLQTRNEKDRVILSAVNYLPVSMANLILSKLLRAANICIFTDTTAFISLKERINTMPFVKRVSMPPYLSLVKKTETAYDAYIMFAEQMNESINIKNRPSLVMEGIYNPKGLDLTPAAKQKAVLYAGSLFRQYGLPLLLEAFSMIEDDDIELWIFGSGEMEDEIVSASKEDNRIKFMGFCSREEVFEYEKKAMLLINTRNPDDEYTKLSFPSKTFEYMVSATPYLTTKIEGIPSEYDQFLYYTDADAKNIAEEIKRILDLPEIQREAFGNKAREFVMKKKNAKVQVGKIISFLNKQMKG